MTKERKIEILKDLLVQLSDSANILCTCEADERCEVVEECIKTLEQQPSEDCVSRTEAKIDVIPNSLYTSEQVIALLDNLSPVTPTHGTCKDCEYMKKDKFGHHCWKCHWCVMDSYKDMMEHFYCADFEKRGDSDGSN